MLDVSDVAKLRSVADSYSVFYAHVLMLVVVVFIRLGEAHRRNPAFEKRDVVAAAQVTITTIDNHYFHRRHVTLARLLDEACELPRGRIVFAARPATHVGFFRRLARWHAFGEDA